MTIRRTGKRMNARLRSLRRHVFAVFGADEAPHEPLRWSALAHVMGVDYSF